MCAVLVISALRRRIGRGGAFLNPGVDAGFQERERQRPRPQDGVVEGAEVEGGAEGFFGAGAEGADLELADLVGAGLAGPADVAVYLGSDVGLAEGGVGFHVVDRLLTRPAAGG